MFPSVSVKESVSDKLVSYKLAGSTSAIMVGPESAGR